MIGRAFAQYGFEATFKGVLNRLKANGMTNDEIEANVDGYWFVSFDLKRSSATTSRCGVVQPKGWEPDPMGLSRCALVLEASVKPSRSAICCGFFGGGAIGRRHCSPLPRQTDDLTTLCGSALREPS